MMGVIVDRLEKNERIYDPLTYIYVARSWDEFISNSYFFFPLVRRRSRKEKEKEKKKKSFTTQSLLSGGSRIFCRLACTSLYDAGGHDWSKTENGRI